MATVNEKMTAIADKIRSLTGQTGTLNLDAMDTQLESANTDKETMITTLGELGVEIESGASLSEAISSLENINLDPILQDKTITPSTSQQTITADSGYDGLDAVTVNAIPNTYVKPTTTKAATTYMPSTSNQTIAAGTYITGTQTIKGDSNLIAENIAEGVNIFGVTGTHSGGGVEQCIVTLVNNTDDFIDVYGLWWNEYFGRYMSYPVGLSDGETETMTSIKESYIFFYIGANNNNRISVSISGEGSLTAFETYAIICMTGDSTITISGIW